MGLKPVEITNGYSMATKKALELLEASTFGTRYPGSRVERSLAHCAEPVKDIREEEEVKQLMRTVMSSKNVDESLADWVAKVQLFDTVLLL